MTQFAQNVVLLHGAEKDGNSGSIESDTAQEAELQAQTELPPGASPTEVDLDELMAKLKALAAKAQQLPMRRSNKQRAVMATAIALSITSGAVAGQHLVPGHTRAAAAPSKSFVDPAANVTGPIGNSSRRTAGGPAGSATP